MLQRKFEARLDFDERTDERALGTVKNLSATYTFTDEAMCCLKHCGSLEVLSLLECPVTDDGIRSLKGLQRLRMISLNGSRGVTDDSLRIIGGLSGLEYLDLSSTGISGAGLGQLHGLRALRVLEVERTAVTEAAIQDLQRAIPDVDVSWSHSGRD